jgi:thymidylate kinase
VKTRTVLVTLSGTHGTGKSTNAGKCYYLLNRQGLRFSYLRHQDLLDPLGFVLRRAARILRFKSTTKFERIEPVRILSSVYYLFIYLPFLAGGIGARKLLGYSTVADRYLYDLIAGSWGNGMSVPLENLLLRMVPRPDVSFVFDADVKRILADRPEHSFEYIVNEKAQYSKLVSVFGLTRVSTDNPPEAVWNSILHDIEAAFSRDDQGRRPGLGA